LRTKKRIVFHAVPIQVCKEKTATSCHSQVETATAVLTNVSASISMNVSLLRSPHLFRLLYQLFAVTSSSNAHIAVSRTKKKIVHLAVPTQACKEKTATFFRSLAVIVTVVRMSALIATWKDVSPVHYLLLNQRLFRLQSQLFAATSSSNVHTAVWKKMKRIVFHAVLTQVYKETTATFFRSLAVIVTVVRMSALIATWKDVSPVHYLLLNQRLFRLQSQLFAATSSSNAHTVVLRMTRLIVHLAVLIQVYKETTAMCFRSLAVIAIVALMNVLIVTWKDVNPLHYRLLSQHLSHRQCQPFVVTSLNSVHIAVSMTRRRIVHLAAPIQLCREMTVMSFHSLEVTAIAVPTNVLIAIWKDANQRLCLLWLRLPYQLAV
jgi:hypothetical protein